MRIAIVGNSGGGKSTLARRLAAELNLSSTEVDSLLWQPGWILKPNEIYRADHERLIAGDRWVIEGLGQLASIPERLARATDIVIVDLPLWMHFWLAAERQIQWTSRTIDHPPAGLTKMPPTESLFRTIWDVDRNWMPQIRRLAADEELQGKRIYRLDLIDLLNSFSMPR